MGTIIQDLYGEGEKLSYAVLCKHQLIRAVQELLDRDPDHP